MYKHIAKKLIKALESGEYTKGVGRLRDSDDKFCCLGVLCNLHAQAHPTLAAKLKLRTHYFGEDIGLPLEVVKWAGMSSGLGRIESKRVSLASINDTSKTFKPVITALSKYWKEI